EGYGESNSRGISHGHSVFEHRRSAADDGIHFQGIRGQRDFSQGATGRLGYARRNEDWRLVNHARRRQQIWADASLALSLCARLRHGVSTSIERGRGFSV